MNISLICLWLLIVTFIFSGVVKLFALQNFKSTLESLRLPVRRFPFIPASICVFEILTASCLLFSVSRVFGQLAIFVMVIGFIWAIYQAKVVQKEKISCNCWGNMTSETLGTSTMIKITILTLLNGYVLWDAPQLTIAEKTPSTDHILYFLFALGTIFLLLLGQNYYALHRMQKERRAQ